MKLISKKVICSTEYVETIESTYLDKSNNKSTWVWCRRPNNRQAVVIAATVNDKLVVIKEMRTTLLSEPCKGVSVGFPAGLIDGDESPVDTACRELYEETGLTVDKVLEVSPAIYSSEGITNESVYLVIVKASGSLSTDNLEDGEDILTTLLDVTEVEQWLISESWGKMSYVIARNFVKFGEL